MSQFVIPSGYELVCFKWDRMPSVLPIAGWISAAQPALSSVSRLAPIPCAIERPVIEEEAERWDGLS